jgi:ribonuclease D
VVGITTENYQRINNTLRLEGRCTKEFVITPPALYVATPEALRDLAHRLQPLLSQDPRLALDTEFIRERTYLPVLEIIQVAADGGRFIALIDFPAVGSNLDPLCDLLLNPEILKIFHAGTQDMEILTSILGEIPPSIYDTQVAAAFAGYSLQTGYGALVQSVLGVKLDKEEGFADWSRRPLTPSMQTYAENDVRYLHALHDRLSGVLANRGRDKWAHEQTAKIMAQATEITPVEDLWRKVGGRHVLDARGLTILRELARWRDAEAERRNKPRRSVVKDDFLVEVARRAPATARMILELRSAPPNLGERAAEALVAAIQRGKAVPEEDRIQPDAPLGLDEQGAALVELLSAVVRVRALEENLPPSLMANGDDLRVLAANRRKPENWPTDLFSDWRGNLLGDNLQATLTGELAVAWDARRGRLTLRRNLLQQDAVESAKSADETSEDAETLPQDV